MTRDEQERTHVVTTYSFFSEHIRVEVNFSGKFRDQVFGFFWRFSQVDKEVFSHSLINYSPTFLF